MENVKGKGVIYRFTSPSGKMYIGQSINFAERYKKYKNNTNSVRKYFSNAISKYDGIEKFYIRFLAVIELSDSVEESKAELDQLEIYYIDKFDTLNCGYNLTGGGNGSFKRTVTDETRKKLSAANTGKVFVDDITLICPICKVEFSVRPNVYRRRLRKSKSNMISCSSKCGAHLGNIIKYNN